MALPPHIADVLERFGVRPETKTALEDLYLSLGSDVFEVLADLVSDLRVVSTLVPEDLSGIQAAVVERFVRRAHPRWLEGTPTGSLWHPREVEGRASGLVAPLGRLPAGERTDFTSRVANALQQILGDDQPMPAGVVLLGRNAHYGGRSNSISFDVVPLEVEDALLIAAAEGRQHTVPGSVGETAGTYNGSGVALVWEVQPNVLKPAGKRNQAIAKVFRKHRNWHVATLVTGLLWLRERTETIYVLRGSGLAVAHEVNPGKPVSPEIADFHDRTLERVVAALGGTIEETDLTEATILLDSGVMNTSLTAFVGKYGPADVLGRAVLPPPPA